MSAKLIVGLVVVLLAVVVWALIRAAAERWPPEGSRPLQPPERFGDGGEA